MSLPHGHSGLVHHVGGHWPRVSVSLLALFTLFSLQGLTTLCNDGQEAVKSCGVVSLACIPVLSPAVSLASGDSVPSTVKRGHHSFFLGPLGGLDAIAPPSFGMAQLRLFIFSTLLTPPDTLTPSIQMFTQQGEERHSKQTGDLSWEWGEEKGPVLTVPPRAAQDIQVAPALPGFRSLVKCYPSP